MWKVICEQTTRCPMWFRYRCFGASYIITWLTKMKIICLPTVVTVVMTLQSIQQTASFGDGQIKDHGRWWALCATTHQTRQTSLWWTGHGGTGDHTPEIMVMMPGSNPSVLGCSQGVSYFLMVWHYTHEPIILHSKQCFTVLQCQQDASLAGSSQKVYAAALSALRGQIYSFCLPCIN